MSVAAAADMRGCGSRTLLVEQAVALVTASSDNLAAIPIVISPATTGTVSATWLSASAGKGKPRFYRRVRVVTSANTNVTYRVELSQQVL